MRAVWLIAAALLCGCATVAPTPPPPERLQFSGSLDLSGKGVGFVLTHVGGLQCNGRYAEGRLPETVLVQVICNDTQTGALTVTKLDGLRGAVVLSGGKPGDVIFEAPPQRAAVVPPPVITPAVAPIGSGVYRTGRSARAGGSGYVRAHARRGGSVRGHYRAGRYVSAHTRRGTTVRGHYRRGRR